MVSTNNGTTNGTTLNLERLHEVARLAPPDDHPRVQARHGKLGVCYACHLSVISHLDTEGRFIGCIAAPEGTVFVLVPVAGTAPVNRVVGTERRATAIEPLKPAPVKTAKPARRKREFVVARYTYAAPKTTKIEALKLSGHRARVLTTLQKAGEEGLLSREIISKSKLPHGSVQMALGWLRDQKLVAAAEDGATT